MNSQGIITQERGTLAEFNLRIPGYPVSYAARPLSLDTDLSLTGTSIIKKTIRITFLGVQSEFFSYSAFRVSGYPVYKHS